AEGQAPVCVLGTHGRARRDSNPSLLIRRYIRTLSWPASQALACQDVARQCAAVVGLWRSCKTKIRPGHAQASGTDLPVRSVTRTSLPQLAGLAQLAWQWTTNASVGVVAPLSAVLLRKS